MFSAQIVFLLGFMCAVYYSSPYKGFCIDNVTALVYSLCYMRVTPLGKKHSGAARTSRASFANVPWRVRAVGRRGRRDLAVLDEPALHAQLKDAL